MDLVGSQKKFSDFFAGGNFSPHQLVVCATAAEVGGRVGVAMRVGMTCLCPGTVHASWLLEPLQQLGYVVQCHDAPCIAEPF